MSDLAARFAFLNEADRLKSVQRANVLMDLSRRENSAEHSWHVALYAMVFGASDRVIAMLLLHDLVEIDVGDHPIHLPHDAAVVQAAEDAAARRLFAMLPGGDALLALWHEFESGQTDDARMARRMDHVQPLFQVLFAPDPLPEHVAIVRRNMQSGRAARLWQEWPEAMTAAQTLLDGGTPQGDLAARLRFLAEADRLKSVTRASLLCDASRRENSAEHSWHLALYALVLAGQAGPSVDIGRVIRMLILHDLVEIDAGDVPIHSRNGAAHSAAAQMAAEQAAATRLFGLLPGDEGAAFHALWTEFEANETPDAIFAKSLDRAQPVMQNIACGGGSWVEYQVTYVQLVERVGNRVARGAPRIWEWLDESARVYFGPR
ncbi:putative hydrolases of HD superfamily [Paracoccus alcaliphilus]|uniref:5'-deoxynucleotidase n=1 Tax=Paracoccus alcaliphilus TaxID=34002 RepID=A0A1H8GDW5_9RHOB|nr:HD domain-containing protein [Paracoccus alcaliphilus]WCR17961.1 HD domain-containing protein [Paracoccus alcaliphilus]SEN41970.1 putative hydrolases of HD superfamily [Paracoccus alcaliphilus]